MIRFLMRLRGLLIPPISRRKAIQIAKFAGMTDVHPAEVLSRMPDHVYPYNYQPADPCWYVIGLWNDGKIMLRSSRLLAISKINGCILFDGSAGDEG